mmetsp:Transcript_5099/g.8316  ORF Transcript_5099/g.8316 Transcript_5099/m.8316 type:complete len:292 (-) Transcript_5099:166-1041(-)
MTAQRLGTKGGKKDDATSETSLLSPQGETKTTAGDLDPMSLFELMVAWTTLLLVVGSFQIVFALVTGCIAYWLYTGSMQLPFTILLVLFSTLFVPVGYSETALHLPVWKYLHKYFGYRKINLGEEMLINPEKRYMLVEYPHGSFPMATVLIATYFDGHYKRYKSLGRTVRGLSATILNYIPLVRHIFAMLGSIPATKENFLDAFESAGACSVLPGGIAEMFMVEENRERIYFKKRFGYIKVALESGVEIIPVFHFGNSQVLRVIGRTGLLAFISRRLKVVVVVVVVVTVVS